MKSTVVALLALLVFAAGALSLANFLHLREETCRREYLGCVAECNLEHDRVRFENALQRSRIEFELGRALSDCRLNNLGNQAAIDLCQADEQAQADEQLAQLDELDDANEAERRDCISECRRLYCEPEDEDHDAVTIDPPVVDIDCIDGNHAPCFKEVPEICTRISGACDNCWRTLCGDEHWSFEADVPLDVTLVAASDPLRDPRVLATSSVNGRRSVLPIPRHIRLSAGERLFLGFDSKQPLAAPGMVTIHRD